MHLQLPKPSDPQHETAESRRAHRPQGRQHLKSARGRTFPSNSTAGTRDQSVRPLNQTVSSSMSSSSLPLVSGILRRTKTRDSRAHRA